MRLTDKAKREMVEAIKNIWGDRFVDAEADKQAGMLVVKGWARGELTDEDVEARRLGTFTFVQEESKKYSAHAPIIKMNIGSF